MAGTALLDDLMANAWPPAVLERRGDWRLRRTGGRTRRANSALAVGGAAQLGALVGQAEDFYRDHGAAPMFQVSTASAPAALPGLLEDRGYKASGRTIVARAATIDVARRCGNAAHEVQVGDEVDDAWFDAYWSIEAARGAGPLDALVYRSISLVPPLDARFVAARDGDHVLGVGQLVVEQGFGGVQCMATRDAARRQGVATSVLGTLAREAAERGVDQLYLAVMADNAPARRLYERAGFRPTHEYRYFAA